MAGDEGLPECSPILEPSMKQEIVSGKECRISEKREGNVWVIHLI